MELCDTCTKKQKDHDIFEALYAMEDEFSTAHGLCEILRDLEKPSHYLCVRVAEHLESMEKHFHHLWDVVREKKREGV